MARRSPAGLIVAAVVAVGLVLGIRYLVAGGSETDCADVTVSASLEKAALLKLVADDYNATDREAKGRCVDVRVAPLASGAAAEALAKDWDEAANGPRPDVWTPASSIWTEVLEERLSTAGRPALLPKDQPSIAQAPLVIAMPQPMAEVLGWPDRDIGWSDLAVLARDPAGWGGRGHPEWGAFKLGKTNPTISTTGLNSTVATFFAATGRSTDLSARDVADPKVREFVTALENSAVHYGDTSLTFLSNLYDAAARGQALTYISAVAVEEKSVWDYNQGNPGGDPATAGQRPPPRVPLVAIYPRDGTLVSDNPFVVLTASWVDDDKRAGAADFLAYVREPDQQKRFTDAAFRTFEGTPGAPITRENGLLPDRKITVLKLPGAAVLNQVVASWVELRKKANLVFVLDVSGSMSTSVDGGATRLDLAKTAAVQSLERLGRQDTLSLWTFSSEAPGETLPYRVLVPPGPVETVRADYPRIIAALEPGGSTALYRTTRAAVAQIRATFDPTRINAVVLLTDGRNEDALDQNLDGLLAYLDTEDERAEVRVFPIAYGEDADLDVLNRIARASTGAAYDAGDPTSIDKVLRDVVSNF